MAKKKNSLLNLTLTMLLITGVAAFLLAMVNQATKDAISQSEKKATEEAIKKVLPNFDNLQQSQVKSYDSDENLKVYYGIKGNDTTGIAIETYTKNGFSGLISVMVGFKPDGTIVNSKVLKHSETPGLGSKMENDKFNNQFNDKNPINYKLAVKKDKGDVDAITASTITSRAYCDALDRAYKSLFAKGDKQ